MGSGALLPFLGPAFVAAVAYVDPGNFATNIAGGAKFGYLLLWVVLAANLMAMLIQTHVGEARDRDRQEPAGGLPRALLATRRIGLWIQAELVAMATDLAEFVGAALGAQPALRDPALPGRPDHRRRVVRDPRAADARLPAARGGDRRAASA